MDFKWGASVAKIKYRKNTRSKKALSPC